MSSVTIPRTLAAAAVLMAAALVVVTRGRYAGDEPSVAVLDAASLPATPTEITPGPSATRLASSAETLAAEKLRELNAMSQTFRNTTFLIAIRDAGFVCNELLRVSGGLDDSPKWMATCSETLAYTIGVASNGTLHVEPFLQYFDGLGVRPIEQVLPAEPLPQPR
jgi:hypothetical protein